jgi:hypothetical protein
VIEPPELTGGHKRTVKDAADKNRMGHSRRQAAASGEAGKVVTDSHEQGIQHATEGESGLRSDQVRER